MDRYSRLDQPEIQKFLFHPKIEQQPPEKANQHNITVNLPDENFLGCKFYFQAKESATILYFHGNGEIVSDYDDIAPLYNAAGFNIFVASYRGYGWSTGTPGVQYMMDDCTFIYDTVCKTMSDMAIDAPLFVMGRSIGCAPAMELCTDYPDTIRGLIVESGFAQTLPLLKNLGCDIAGQTINEEEGFGNLEKIESIIMPTLFLHGSQDSIIPIHQAEKLQAFSGARTKKFFVIPGADHNSVLAAGGDQYFTTLRDFIDDITGKSSWRTRRKKYKER